jgi:hypothetical protein
MTVLDAAPFESVDQDYLVDARQMEALSFAVHIPIVSSGSPSQRGAATRFGLPLTLIFDGGPLLAIGVLALLTCVAVASVALAVAAAAVGATAIRPRYSKRG